MNFRPFLCALLVVWTALSVPKLNAQFNTGSGPFNSVTAALRQSDGKILIGGGFTSVNGSPRNGIARLNPDGSLDVGFNPGLGANYGSNVKSFAVAPDGKIYAGGNFIYVRQTDPTRPFAPTVFPGLIRLNADGSVDDSFDPGIGFRGGPGDNPILPAPLPNVNAILLQPDGNLLVCGFFATYNDAPVWGLTRLLPNGQKDPSFNTDLGIVNGIPAGGAGQNNPAPGPNLGDVRAMALLANGKILVAGRFDYWDLRGRRGIARVNANGSLDETFNPELGATNQDPGTDDLGLGGDVNAVVVQPDGKILLGGNFLLFNGVPRRNLARLLPDGALDLSFNTGPAISVGTSEPIFGIALDPEGQVYIVGSFASVNNVLRRGIARLSPTGSVDVLFDPGLGFLNGIAKIIFRQPDGLLVVAGNFDTYNGTAVLAITRLTTNAAIDVGPGGDTGGENDQIIGSIDFSFKTTPGANAQINAVAVRPDGKVLLGGQFTTYNGSPAFRVVRTRADGSYDNGVFVDEVQVEPAFTPGLGPNGFVFALQRLSNEKILVAGSFTSFDGNARFGMARLLPDGAVDTTFDSSRGPNGSVQAFAVQPDGKVIIGGTFTQFQDGTSRQGIARLNANGTLDTSFNPGTATNGAVEGVALQSDGKIIAVGRFTSFDGRTVGRIVRLNSNGSYDSTFAAGSGAENTIKAVVVQSDGKILIAGDFGQFKGRSRNRIARLNTDGSVDLGFDVGVGPSGIVRCIALERTGKIFVAGEYGSYNGVAQAFNPARLLPNGSLDTTFTPPVASTPTINITALAIQPNDQIVAVGSFFANLVIPDPTVGDPGRTRTLVFNNAIRLQNFIPDAKLTNVSSRGKVETGSGVMIGGFVVRGSTPKRVLIRALGPSVGAAGVLGFLQAPQLEVFNQAGQVIGYNDGWRNGGRADDVLSTRIVPGNAADAALVLTLAPGSYTTKVSGKNGTTGVALVEVYDVDIAAAPRIINLSTRAVVQAGENVLIGGFAVHDTRNGPKHVVVRAMGPSLQSYGVAGALVRPVLTIFNAAGQTIATNAGWRSNAASARVQSAGLAPSDDREAALFLELPEGTYTAIVSGEGGSSGVALVEVYEVE